MLLKNLLVCFFILSIAGPAAAQGGLYDSPPPPDASFVRVLSLSSDSPAQIEVGGTILEVGAGALLPYKILTAGTYSLDLASGAASVTTSAQHYLTLVLTGLPERPIAVLDDTLAAAPSKAVLVFYNLTGQQVDLTTADGKTKVLGPVPELSSANRAVNGITVAFGLSSSGNLLASSSEFALERGKVYSIVAAGSGDNVTLNLVENTISK